MGIQTEAASAPDFHALFDATPTPCLVLAPDPRFTIVAVNAAYLRATRTVREEILGKGLFEVFPDNPADPAANGERNLRASLERVIRTRAPDTMAIQKYDIPKPGSGGREFEERYWSPINAPVLGVGGALKYILHRAEDVSELVRLRGGATESATEIASQARELAAANARLREAKEQLEDRVRERTIDLTRSEAWFRQVADSMPQIVWTARPDGFVDTYNERWYQYTGRPRDEGGDPSWEPVVHPDDLARLRAAWSRSLATGEPYDIEFRIRNGATGKYCWHLSRAVPVRDDEGRIVQWFGTNTNIDEQKQAVLQLEKERDLRERFVQSLSHDLRTPLSAAKLGAQLLIRKAEDPAAVQRLAGRIGDSLERVDQMIRDLLDAGRIKAGERLPLDIRACDLSEIARSTIEDLGTVHGDRFVLQADPRVEGHWSCDGLRRILENLCNNAIKYGDSHRPVIVRLDQDAQQVRIEVHNEGKAIAPEDQGTLFEPFRRTASARSGGQKGWGLGLALVQGLAEAHGGSAGVESSPERGTTFRVVLPMDARGAREHAGP